MAKAAFICRGFGAIRPMWRPTTTFATPIRPTKARPGRNRAARNMSCPSPSTTPKSLSGAAKTRTDQPDFDDHRRRKSSDYRDLLAPARTRSAAIPNRVVRRQKVAVKIRSAQRTQAFRLSGGGTKRIPISRPQVVAGKDGGDSRHFPR